MDLGDVEFPDIFSQQINSIQVFSCRPKYEGPYGVFGVVRLYPEHGDGDVILPVPRAKFFERRRGRRCESLVSCTFWKISLKQVIYKQNIY